MIEERIASDRFYQFLERTWMWQQLPVALLFYAWGGWSFVVFGVCARITAGIFGHWLIGYFAHNHGPMNHEVRGAAVQGHNVRWTSLLTMGECWHNNHHAFPGSARLGLREDEWDPGWWMLLGIRKLGLAWSLRLPGDLAFRPELVRISQPARKHSHSLLDVIQMLLRPTAHDGTELIWPGKIVGTHSLRRLTHKATVLRVDPSVDRLMFGTKDGVLLLGLPAVCVATFRHRRLPTRLVAILLLSIAVSVEAVRHQA
jgi:hypothetical protein